MQNYRNLKVWQKAHQLALQTYEVPAYLLKPEAWPLRDQILRAVISIPSNIAEGLGEALIQITGDSSGTRWVPVTNSSLSSFSPAIFISFRVKSIPA
jgi:hypothetical protein